MHCLSPRCLSPPRLSHSSPLPFALLQGQPDAQGVRAAAWCLEHSLGCDLWDAYQRGILVFEPTGLRQVKAEEKAKARRKLELEEPSAATAAAAGPSAAGA